MDQAPSRFRRRLWTILGSAALVVVISGIIWYRSDSDLAAIDARAQVMGVATTWEALGLKTSPPERIRIWKSCEALMAQHLPIYEFDCDKSPTNLPLLNFLPVPDALYRHVSKYPPDKIQELFKLIDVMGTTPLALSEVPDSSKFPQITTLIRLQACLRHIAAASEEPRPILRRMVEINRSFDCSCRLLSVVRNNSIALTMETIASHLMTMSKPVPDLAVQIDALMARFDADLLDAMVGEFIIQRTKFAKIHAQPMGSDDFFPSHFDSVMIRSGRQQALDLQLDFLAALQHLPPRYDTFISDWEQRRPPIPSTDVGFLRISECLSRLTDGLNRDILARHYQTKLHLALVAAELRQAPWPVDCFDPAGKPLRRFERDGKLVGAYSVGVNGSDDGGDEKADITFPLYGPWKLQAPDTSPTP